MLIVRVKDSGLDLFSSSIFILLFSDLGLEFNMTLHMIVISCYKSWLYIITCHIKEYRRF